jgi:hypothetical protein
VVVRLRITLGFTADSQARSSWLDVVKGLLDLGDSLDDGGGWSVAVDRVGIAEFSLQRSDLVLQITHVFERDTVSAIVDLVVSGSEAESSICIIR